MHRESIRKIGKEFWEGVKISKCRGEIEFSKKLLRFFVIE